MPARPSGASPEPTELRAELERILARDPSLCRLVHPQPGDPEVPQYEVICRGIAPYYVVPVSAPGRDGHLWVSRLPGFHRAQTRLELDALYELGVRRVVCLVPETTLVDVHHAGGYLRQARDRFGKRFHLLPIADHRVPIDDESFDRCVTTVDDALGRGERVLVHCVGGCGRSGMFVACLLVRGGMDPRAAIGAFRAARRCGPETPEQVAYVFRYARRAGAAAPPTPPRLRLTRGPDGEPIQLARGGLARVMLGRAYFAAGRPRRVAIKCFGKPLDARGARQLQATIDVLRKAGVRLPRMFVARLPNGEWVQVSPLFGSTRRGSKLAQPGQYYRLLGPVGRRFAIDQLTRVANAGHMPTLDLFLLFADGRGDLIPLDLDLVAPEPDASRRAAKLLQCLIQVGCDAPERDRLLEVADAVANPEVRGEARRLLTTTGSPYRAYWTLE